MFKSKNKQSLAQQLKNKLSFSTPLPKDAHGGAVRPGSGLRMPQIPIPAEESIMKQSIREKLSASTNTYVDHYGGFFQEHSIMAEFNHLKKTRLPGVYVIPSCSNPLVWYGVVFIRQGTYQDGVFRFALNIPDNYPDGDCPSVIFTPPVFHPLIDASTGKLDLTKGFPTWRTGTNHIWQVLLYMRKIFYKFDSANPVNKEAAELYETDIATFKKKVKEHITTMTSNVYEDLNDNDPHALLFREWDPAVHEPCRDMFVSLKGEEGVENEDEEALLFTQTKLSGLSFLEPGTSAIFSKEN